MAVEKVKRAMVFGSAPCDNWHFLNRYLDGKPWLVICADGGVQNATDAGLDPDYLIGDWDSGGAPQAGISCTTLSPEKDLSDLQAAVELALSKGALELMLLGCTGGRLDHTASNLMLTEWIAAQGGQAIIVDESNEVRYLDSDHVSVLNTPGFRYLSIIPLDRIITGVYLQGVKYPLSNATLTRGDTFSVSNEPTGPIAEVTVGSGRVLIIRSEPQVIIDSLK